MIYADGKTHKNNTSGICHRTLPALFHVGVPRLRGDVCGWMEHMLAYITPKAVCQCGGAAQAQSASHRFVPEQVTAWEDQTPQPSERRTEELPN